MSRRIVGGKFNKWIVILEEFDLDFQYAKSKKSLVFAELIAKFLVEEDSFPDEHIFLISSSDPWYGDILVYLQTLKSSCNLVARRTTQITLTCKKIPHHYTIEG